MSHQHVIKLVYDATLAKKPRVNPSVNVMIREDEEHF